MLGERLKLLREKRGLSQEQIADMLGIKRERYANYEQQRRGKVNPGLDFLQKVADFHGVSTDYLLGRTDYLEPPEKLRDLIDNAEFKKQEKIDWLRIAEIVEKYKNLDE